MYDPTTARWLSRDPISFKGGDANLYRYVGNRPTNFADKSGLLSKEAKQILDGYHQAVSESTCPGEPIGTIIIDTLIQAKGNNAAALALILEIRNENNGTYDNDDWASVDHFFNAWNAQDFARPFLGPTIFSRVLGGFWGTGANTGYYWCKKGGIPVVQDRPDRPPSPPTLQQWWWGERGGDASFWYNTNMRIGGQEWRSFLNWIDKIQDDY